MPTATYWADAYLEKRRSAAEAIRLIKSGQRVFIGSACGQPELQYKLEIANFFVGGVSGQSQAIVEGFFAHCLLIR